MSAATETEDRPSRRRPSNRLTAFYRTTVGKKVVMATSGAVLLLFVVSHLAGDLQIFLGAEKLNRYALFLRGMPELLSLARIGLLVALIVHVVASAQVVLANRRARPTARLNRDYVKASLAVEREPLKNV